MQNSVFDETAPAERASRVPGFKVLVFIRHARYGGTKHAESDCEHAAAGGVYNNDMKRILGVLGIAACALATAWRTASAQLRVSVGAGAGVAGSTEQSLSNGTGAPVVMAQVVRPAGPVLGIGGEVDYWRGHDGHVGFATALVQAHLPVVPFRLAVGVGYGDGDPDGQRNAGGLAGQIGAAYDITLPLAPIALTVFGNAFLAHASIRYIQTVDAGIALTWR